MLRTNFNDLPILLVQGQVRHSRGSQAYRHTIDGEPMTLPATGGITYNAQIGDRCVGWAADHLEPGVTMRNENEDYNAAVQGLSCIGNVAIVRSGDAKGARGFVTGKHGGCEHLLCYFDPETLEKMSIGDTIDVRTQGQGIKLLDYPEILLRNMSPALLEKMNITEKDGGKLTVGVAKIVPGCIMGSGLGASPPITVTTTSPCMTNRSASSMDWISCALAISLQFRTQIPVMDATSSPVPSPSVL